jgi:predicted amidohydrolase
MTGPLVAAIQMTSGFDIAANLGTAARLIGEASARGAVVAVLPENYAFMGRGEA